MNLYALNKRLEDMEPWYTKVDSWMFDQKWWPYAVNRFVRDIPWQFRKLKYFFVRGWKGWAPMDTWSFDRYLARVIKEGLEHIIKNSHGYKTGLCPACKDPNRVNAKNSFEPAACTCEQEWPAMLQQIADGVVAVGEFDDNEEMNELIHKDFEAYKKLSEAAFSKQKEALLLFAEHFNGLWD